MTTTAHPLSALPTRPSTGRRIINVVRLQFINTQTFIWVPALILVATVFVTLVILGMLPTDEPKNSLGAQSPMWYFVAAGAMAMTYSFPFAQAMSVTRREFFIGTLLAAAVSSAGLSTAFLLIAGIERLTDGYGFNGYIAYVPWVFENGWVSAWLTYLCLPLFAFVLGFWFATIYKLLGPLGLTVTIVGASLVLLGTIFTITRTESWPTVFEAFQALGPTGVTLCGIGLTAILALGSYATLRKASN